jgi:hypothetical protein
MPTTKKATPDPTGWRDPLYAVAIVAIFIVGAVAVIDLLQDGTISANILALIISVIGPITPALLMRRRNGQS